MLVLTRKVGEKVQIADNIIITVLGCHHGTIKLGFEAPREIMILREELIKKEEKSDDPIGNETDSPR